jgi:hypothetical protein
MAIRPSDENDATVMYGPGVRLATMVLPLLTASAVLFVVLCLTLEAWQSGSAAAPGAAKPPLDMLGSEAAVIVYCIILAGVLGAAVRLLGRRLRTEPELPGGDGVSGIATHLFLGGAFAFAAGFLLPHALAAGTISTSYNVWTLIIVGGAAGYASTGMAGSFHEGLQGLLTGVRQGVADAIVKEEVSKTIFESAKEAMALPEPVAYDGAVEFEVTDEYKQSAVQYRPPEAGSGGFATATSEPALWLKPDTNYRIQARLVPQALGETGRAPFPIRLPIGIEGSAAPVVPLVIRIDYGIPETSAETRQAEARIDAATELPPFTFRTPSLSILQPPTVLPDAEAAMPRRLVISVLQNRIPYLRRQIPLVVNALPPAAGAWANRPP